MDENKISMMIGDRNVSEPRVPQSLMSPSTPRPVACPHRLQRVAGRRSVWHCGQLTADTYASRAHTTSPRIVSEDVSAI
jgi:hypothetical protein